MLNLKEEHSKFVKLYSFSSGATSPTNIKLVEEMTSHLDEEIFKNPNSKFLDPCAGTGTFGVVLHDRLLKYHDSKWIFENMIFMIDTSRVNCDLLKKLGFVNVYNEDFLNLKLDMKFDVIVGNPPYQKSDNKRWKLWVSFIDKSFPLLKNNGYLSYITPIAWLEGMGSELELARNLLYSNDIRYVNINLESYFNNVGERIGCFIVKKSKYNGNTLIENLNNTFEIDITKYSTNPLQSSISNKVFSFTEKIEHKNFLSYKTKDIDNEQCSETKTDDFSIKVIHSGSQILYYKPEFVPSKYNGSKIIVNMSGHYYVNGKNYIYYTDSDIPGRNTTGVYVDSTNKDAIEFILKSKLYRYIIYTNKSSGFNSVPFKNLPKFNDDLIKCTSDESLYSYFNLTQEEIDYIENYVG